MSSKPSGIASIPTSINELPDEILLEILSHCGPEDILLIIPDVCRRWKAVTKELILWKKLSYECDRSSDFSRVAHVSCTSLLVFKVK